MARPVPLKRLTCSCLKLVSDMTISPLNMIVNKYIGFYHPTQSNNFANLQNIDPKFDL